uniref:Uncharacterized protein n=1 Tax=Panagrolaimus davidi TaxID=227884 RepID=A0A914R3F8_9BILA
MLLEDQDGKTLELLKGYLQNPGPDIVIFDEGHRLKNDKTRSYIKKMGMKTRRRILLTGTPMENGPMELYHIVEMIAPGFLGEEEVYNEDYGWKIERGKFADASETNKRIAREKEVELYEKLKEIMNRKDVEYLSKLIDVNKKEVTITFCETEDQSKLFDKAEEEYNSAPPGEKKFSKHFHRLLQITAHPIIVEAKERKRKHQQNFASCSTKLKDPNRSNQMRALFNIIEACGKNDEKLVVYTQSIPILDFIEHKLIIAFGWKKDVDFFRIDGKINAMQRAIHVKEFNNERNKKARLFLFSIKAGSIGINLIGANRMVLFDHCFNPVHNTQGWLLLLCSVYIFNLLATYRIYRIGQKRDVFIYRFITKNSSGDCVLRRQIAKEQQSKRLIDGRKNIVSKYSKKDIETKRGHGNYELITDERIQELENEFNDKLLIDVVEKMKDGIIEVSDHDEHFEETLGISDNLDLSAEFEDSV